MTFTRPPRQRRQHTTLHNPVGLWQLDGDMTDSSGNGFDLSLDTTHWPSATERYVPLNDSIRAFYFDGITALVRAPATADLAITGDMTFLMLIAWYDQPPGFVPNDDAYVISHRGPTPNNNADNFLYSAAGSLRRLLWFQEFDAGTNQLHRSTDSAPQHWHHFAGRREDGVVQFFVDGLPLAAASAALTAPNGGGDGRFRLGAQTAALSAYLGAMASVKVCDTALTDQQIADEYGRTLG